MNLSNFVNNTLIGNRTLEFWRIGIYRNDVRNERSGRWAFLVEPMGIPQTELRTPLGVFVYHWPLSSSLAASSTCQQT